MSLINQVLRDLDKRQAAAPSPAAASVKPAPLSKVPSALQRARRWGLGLAITAAAVVVGGVAQGNLNWPAGAGPSSASAAVPLPAPTPLPTAAPAPAPIVTAVALPAASEEAPLTVQAARPAAPAPKPAGAQAPAPAMQVAVATPTSRAAPGLSARPPARARQADPIASPAESTPNAVVPARPETRIAKHMASRTPRERAEAEYQRGVVAHQAGQINVSAEAFMAALREDSAYAPPRQAQAGLLIGQSRFDEALTLLQEGIALTPQQPALAQMLARLQAERLDLSAAADTLKTALPNATHNPEYLGFYAAILQRAERHAEANEQFSAALRLAPANSVWWMGLGISLAASGQDSAAREAFMRAQATGSLPAEAGRYVELRLRQMM